MRIAGVYASAFFIELAEYFIFLFFILQVQRREINFLYVYRDEKQQRITPRYILSDWGIPPMTKHNLFTFKTHEIMKKINEIAVINSVSLNEKLYSFNEDNETFRVALRITYSVVDSDDNKDNDVISLSEFAESGCVVGKTYSCILNFDRVLEGGKHTEKEQDKALEELSKKFVGKKARFSTFDYTISELTDGNEKSITDGEHTYSSLANTYLGNVDDEAAELRKLKTRLADMIDDNFDYSTDD